MKKRIIGQEGGNYENKYTTQNPISKYLVSNFQSNLLSLVHKISPEKIHEVGCGEGYLSNLILNEGFDIFGSDVSEEVIEIAKQRALSISSVQGCKPYFKCSSIYDLDESDSANMIICCEVFEHLDFPEKALEKIATIAKPYVIFSVPREPIWRSLNFMRGKYLKDLGNTPGHVQHWGKSNFISFVEKHFEIIEVRSPLPWTMLLAKVKK